MCLPPQNKHLIIFGSEVGDAVEHDHRVDLILSHIIFHAGQIISGVKQVDLRKILGQEGARLSA